MIQEEAKNTPVRLSTKDQLRALGISVSFADTNLESLEEESKALTVAEDFDVNHLESDDDLADQG